MQLAAFHRAHYAPDHAGLAIAGDISMAEARKLIEREAGGLDEAGTSAGGGVGSEPALTGAEDLSSSRGPTRCRPT